MSQDTPQSERQIEERIEARIAQARKEEIIDTYEDLIETIWQRILPTLGRVTVMAITERALMLTSESYPLVRQLQVTPDGISFARLKANLTDELREGLRDALKELITNQIDILAMLTGDVLVKQLLKEIEGKTSND